MSDDHALRWLLQSCADGINPALLVSILGEVPAALTRAKDDRSRNARLTRALRYVVAGGLAIAVPVVLAELGKKHVVWAGHPGFPSGHMTFATAASAAIIAYRGRSWLILCAPCVGIMGYALVYLGHHHPPEVAGGFVLGAVLGTVITKLLAPSVRPGVAQPLDVPVEE